MRGRCWLDPDASDNGHGYATSFGQYAHRRSYEFFVGAIPDGLELDHLCENKACYNQAHLEAVTHAENCRRRGGWNTGMRVEFCKHGHAMTEENKVYRSSGYASCRQCKREQERRWADAKRRREGVPKRVQGARRRGDRY